MTKQKLTFNVPSASQQVKDEFKGKRDSLEIKLPQFLEYVIAQDNNYDNPHGYNHIRNVFYGRCADLNLNKLLSDYEESINKIA